MSKQKDAVEKGTIQRIFDNENNFKPKVQVVHIKLIQSKQKQRYRLILSDGEHYIQSMLGSSNNSMIFNDLIKLNSILQLDAFETIVMDGRHVCIVIQCTVTDYANAQFGHPSNIQPLPKNNDNTKVCLHSVLWVTKQNINNYPCTLAL